MLWSEGGHEARRGTGGVRRGMRMAGHGLAVGGGDGGRGMGSLGSSARPPTSENILVGNEMYQRGPKLEVDEKYKNIFGL